MTDEEDVNLKAMFNEMGAQPKARTKEELQHWLLDYAASLKSEPQMHTQCTAPQVITVFGWKPWLVKFSADRGNEGYDLWRHQVQSHQRKASGERYLRRDQTITVWEGKQHCSLLGGRSFHH